MLSTCPVNPIRPQTQNSFVYVYWLSKLKDHRLSDELHATHTVNNTSRLSEISS